LTAAVALGMPSPALATHSGPEDYAAGHGSAGDESFDFSARSYDDSQDSHGNMTLTSPVLGALHAEVECLSVLGLGDPGTPGGIAEVSGLITRASGIDGVLGQALKFQVTDGGGTSGDAFRAVIEPAETVEFCSPAPGIVPVDDGDIKVIDEAPRGTL
jgi:hypothetical protein